MVFVPHRLISQLELLFYGKIVEFSFLPLLQGSWDQLESCPFAGWVSTRSFSTAINAYNLRGTTSFWSLQKTCGTFVKGKFILKFSESLPKKDTCFT